MKTNWIAVGAVAALISTVGTGAWAQGKTFAHTTIMADDNMGMTTTDTPDYSLLANPLFNYSELKSAKAKGLSDSQVASALYIAKMTGMSVRDITDKALSGKTFSQMAYDDNLKVSDVLEADTEKQQIASYMAAYETTGWMALKNPSATSDTNMNQ